MQQGFWHEFRTCFRGPSPWIAWLAMAYLVFLIPALVWLVVGLFRAESTRDQLLFATGVIVAVVLIGFLKIWFWMRMNRLGVETRLSRLEERQH